MPEEPTESKSSETSGHHLSRVSQPRDVDWTEVTRYPAFRTLISSKTRFLIPVLILSLGFFLGTMVLVGLAPDFAARRVFGPVSIGYSLVFATYIITWGVALLYVRVANRDFDPKAADAVSELHEHQRQGEDNA